MQVVCDLYCVGPGNTVEQSIHVKLAPFVSDETLLVISSENATHHIVLDAGLVWAF